MIDYTLKGAAAISGYAEMKPQRQPGNHTPVTICAELARQVAADAGLERAQIDGLLTATPFSNYNILWPSYLCEYLNIRPRYFDTVDIGGASAAGMVWRAAAAIQAGMCNHVLCVTAEVMDSRFFARLAHLMPQSDLEFEIPYGNVPANAGYAMVAMRHMHEYGTTSRQLAKVAVDQRFNAQQNPDALFYGKELTIDDVLGSRTIMEPLHLFEIVSPCTGGAAVIVSRADLAARGPNRPVKLLGAGEAGTSISIANAPSLTKSWIEAAAKSAFAMSGLTPQRMQFIQPYDCYTITVAITLEDMGFCKKGQGGPFIAERDLTWQGDLPCNTHGGQLSFGQAGQAGGMSHVVEAARQLMGRAGGRQIPNATIGLAHGNGGILGEQVTLIFGNE